MSLGGEFAIIARYFAPLAKSAPLAFGLKDDAALLVPSKGKSLVVTADAIVEGVHYLPGDSPELIARKLLRVNLSDLAAKGAVATGYVLTCAFSRGVKEDWIARFARGLRADQKIYGIHLLGGDTVSTPGPAMFSVTMFGEVSGKTMLRRDRARPGDWIAVSGTIGDGGLGLEEIRSPRDGLSAAQSKALIGRYHLPQPRTILGPSLRLVARAAMDVSDGLIQDLGHMARASGVRIRLSLSDVPLSPSARALAKADPDVRLRAVTAGDDYEIVCAIPPARWLSALAAARRSRTRLTRIGVVTAGRGVEGIGEDGGPIAIAAGGWDHFAR